jgi:hypothetical protein
MTSHAKTLASAALLAALALLSGCSTTVVRIPGLGGTPALVIGPVWLVCGVLGAWIATTKGRGGCVWFLVCAILGPLGVILAAVVSRER